MIGSWGGVAFEASDERVLTPKNITRSGGSRWAVHETLGGKPLTQYLGPQLRSVTFDVTLRATLGVRPREALERLHRASEGSEAFPLVIGGVPMADGPMRLTDISETWGEMFDRGELFSASVNLSFEEYN